MSVADKHSMTLYRTSSYAISPIRLSSLQSAKQLRHQRQSVRMSGSSSITPALATLNKTSTYKSFSQGTPYLGLSQVFVSSQVRRHPAHRPQEGLRHSRQLYESFKAVQDCDVLNHEVSEIRTLARDVSDEPHDLLYISQVRGAKNDVDGWYYVKLRGEKFLQLSSFSHKYLSRLLRSVGKVGEDPNRLQLHDPHFFT